MQRMVEEVFVENRVELTTLDHIQGVSEFNDRDAGWLQEARETGDQIIDVVDMSRHVVGDHHIGELLFASDLFGAPGPEEIVNRWHADGVCPRYRPVGRIDTKAINPTIDKVMDQGYVIAGTLNHETGGAERVFPDQLLVMLG